MAPLFAPSSYCVYKYDRQEHSLYIGSTQPTGTAAIAAKGTAVAAATRRWHDTPNNGTVVAKQLWKRRRMAGSGRIKTNETPQSRQCMRGQPAPTDADVARSATNRSNRKARAITPIPSDCSAIVLLCTVIGTNTRDSEEASKPPRLQCVLLKAQPLPL